MNRSEVSWNSIVKKTSFAIVMRKILQSEDGGCDGEK
jgi:hypothetical protein